MKFVSVFTAALCFATISAAQGNIKDEYWPILISGDIPRIEKVLDQLDDDVKAGKASYDDQRSVYNLLEVSHPAIHDLLDRWLKLDPDSRHALAGKLWQLRWIAKFHRGYDAARWVHSQAHQAHNKNLAAAQEIAEVLLKKYPDFVPGTDGILRQLMDYGGRENADRYLSIILSHAPNRGSLMRGVWGFAPRWGGSYREMARLCRKFAPLIEDKDFNADICIADAILDFNVTSQLYLKIAQAALDRNEDHVSRSARFWDAVKYRVDPEKALAIYQESAVPNRVWAGQLLSALRNTNFELGWSLREDAIAAQTASELKQYERDPFNPLLIAAKIASLSAPMAEFQYGHMERRNKKAEELNLPVDRHWTEQETAKIRPFMEQEQEELKRIEGEVWEKVLPLLYDLDRYGTFNAKAWNTRLSSHRAYPNHDDSLVRGLERNIAIYSNFKVENSQYYISNLRSVRESYDRMSKNGETTRQGKNFDPAAERDALNCELVVATRLVINSCENVPNQVLCTDERRWYKTPWEMLSEAKKLKLCPSMLYAPIYQLKLPEPLTIEDLQ